MACIEIAVSATVLLIIGISLIYRYLLALGSILPRQPTVPADNPTTRFAIAIPAHNEGPVIGATLDKLGELDYPSELYEVYVVADHCTDNTVATVQEHGAICFERAEGVRGGKGAALAWLFERISGKPYDAVVVFDADTLTDAAFLRVMDARLAQGDLVVQGCHRILNPQDGWYPAFAWGMFMVDNRFQNLGRSNLGLSCKLMGDSVCFRADLVQRLCWGGGLTEDYEFRLRLLLEGVRIHYEPAAIGYGEAPVSWAAARSQRARWLRGTFQAGRRYTWFLLCEGLRRRDAALLDGVAQTLLPSLSTLTLIGGGMLVMHVVLSTVFTPVLIYLWAGVAGLLIVYPLLGLALERAPRKAYLAILSGPVFILWRTWLSLLARFGREPGMWVRTSRRINS